MQFHFRANQSHFHKNGFTLRLALKLKRTEAQGNSEMAYLITDIGFSHTFLIDINSFKIFSGGGSVYLNIYSRPLQLVLCCGF